MGGCELGFCLTNPLIHYCGKKKKRNKMSLFSFDFDEPVVCTAIHNGHFVSPEVLSNFAVTEEVRFREEDPQTDFFTGICNNRILASNSRFEFDLNRSREKAIYLKPEDAWGLIVRKDQPADDVIKKTLERYDLFYRRAKLMLEEMNRTYGNFFVYDIHSYNHHRQGKDAEFDKAELNPEIILGTNNMPQHWQPLVDKIQSRMLEYDFMGRKIDVRQNVKFDGGNFSRWIHTTFPNEVCCIAIEFKKIFMDEWSGEFYPDVMMELKKLLASTKDVIIDYLKTKQ